jgi:membrane protease YdiL (CAAX protease family)
MPAPESPETEERELPFSWTVLGFEFALALVAVFLGVTLGPDPRETIPPRTEAGEIGQAIGWGLLAAFPCFALMWLAERLPLQPFRTLQTIVEERVAPLFLDLSLAEVIAIGLAAGVGEELLFRGWFQSSLTGGDSATNLSIASGLIAASLLFGLCHWLTAAYGILATVMGLYLGGLLLWFDNLIVPITAHAFYDVLAILHLQRSHAKQVNQE